MIISYKLLVDMFEGKNESGVRFLRRHGDHWFPFALFPPLESGWPPESIISTISQKSIFFA